MGRPATRGPLTPLIAAAGGAAYLAKLMGVSYGTISRWNRGAAHPSASARILLALLAQQRGLPSPGRWCRA